MKEQTNGERFDEFMSLVKGNENIEQFNLYEHKETIATADTVQGYPELEGNMTAVEWIISQYIKDGFFKKGVYEQAMEMEKQQIVDAVNKFALGSDEVVRIILKKYNLLNTGESYYNETYGSNKGV